MIPATLTRCAPKGHDERRRSRATLPGSVTVAAIFLRLRAQARSQWHSWVLVVVLAGLAGGATIATLAGARRTETAYPRFLRGTRSFDVIVTNGTTPETVNREFAFDDVSHLPQVIDAARFSYYSPLGTTLSGHPINPNNLVPFASSDGRFGSELNGARILRGRWPRNENEVAITFAAADSLAVKLGDSLPLRLSGPAAMASASDATGAVESFFVVGVVAMQGGFPPLTGGLPPLILFSSQYARAHPDASEVFAVRLRRGTGDIPAFEQALDGLAHGQPVVTTDQSELTSAVQRSLVVQASALRLLGTLFGCLAALLMAQAIARQRFVDTDDGAVLRALGTTSAQFAALGVVRTMLIGLAAALVAVSSAVALSFLTPMGVARQAELHPGIEINAAYAAIGAGTVFLLVTAMGSLAAWVSARAAFSGGSAGTSAAGPSRLVPGLHRAGLSAPATWGVTMALGSGSGRAAIPVGSIIISVVLAVATIASASSFSANLSRLFHRPRRYGWNWDVQIGDTFAPSLIGDAQHLATLPAVTAVAIGSISRLRVGSLRVDTLAIEGMKGSIVPVVVEGRAPAGPGEILLGTRTLKALRARVGGMVVVGDSQHPAHLRVVGRGVLTEFAGGARLGNGAALTLEGMREIVAETTADVVLLRFRPGPEGRALLAALVKAPPGEPPANIYLPQEPTDLADLERVGGLPSVVAGLMALLAAATLGHALITSVRRRRRDLAVLKVLGFVGRQVSAAVAWHASVVAIAGTLIGLPLGVAAGRAGWRLFADLQGVPSDPTTPALALLLLIPATLLVANLTAVVPAWLAARTQATATLRAQ